MTVIPVYYGSGWSAGDSTYGLVRTLASGITSTALWTVVRKYTNGTGASITSSISVYPDLFVSASQTTGAWLGQTWTSDLSSYVVAALIALGYPSGENVQYLIFTDSSMMNSLRTATGYCQSFCGYHSWTGITPYAFLGTGCPAGCAMGTNNGFGAETLPVGSVMLHEMLEILTDVYSTGYHDVSNVGTEAEDLCNFVMAPVAPGVNYYYNSSVYWNVNVSGRLYFLQSMWDPVLAACSMDGITHA